MSRQALDRTAIEIRQRLEQATTEEQFQAVGTLCREALISLAQAVFDSAQHPTLDGIKASATDFKRMIEAYIAVELAGASNEVLRRHARAAFDLANELQHKRTADFRHAALCAEATVAVINLRLFQVRETPDLAGPESLNYQTRTELLYQIVPRLSVLSILSLLSPRKINNLRVINEPFAFDSHTPPPNPSCLTKAYKTSRGQRTVITAAGPVLVLKFLAARMTSGSRSLLLFGEGIHFRGSH
jgi:hypothetical protein